MFLDSIFPLNFALSPPVWDLFNYFERRYSLRIDVAFIGKFGVDVSVRYHFLESRVDLSIGSLSHKWNSFFERLRSLVLLL